MKTLTKEHLYEFIEKYNFATLINHHDGKLNISHIPVMLDRDKGDHGTLIWHVSKQNPHACGFDGDKEALFIFNGPHAYISPTWYNSSPNVPTWNYAVVHAHGKPEQVSEKQLADDLTQLVLKYESDTYIIPNDYKNKLISHIVGFSMEITKIESTFKLGLNRSIKDQEGILEGLRNNPDTDQLSLADLMQSLQNR